MAWEYEGLFDAIPSEGEDLLSYFWRSEATAIRVGNMGYRTRTTKAGTRLEAEIYPIFGRCMERTARAAKKNLTKDRQYKLNIRRAKHKLILLMEENFDYWKDNMITLTYNDKNEPNTLARCKKDLRNFFNKLKRKREKEGLPELKYIYAIGHDEHQRMHAHAVISGGISQEEILKMWGKGIVHNNPLQNYGGGMQGAANYLYEQNENAKHRGDRANYHMWSGSRNLKQPREHVSDRKMSNRKVKMLSLSFGNDAKEVMEKVYPGYTLEKCHLRFSDVVDGVYIQCVMRKKEEMTPWERLKRKLKNTRSIPST